MHVGAIDIGSNSIRLLVADVRASDGEIKPLLRAGVACRLGRGLEATGLLDAEALESAVEVVAGMARQAQTLGVENLVVAATHAIRAASNQAAALEVLGRACGRPVEVLSGEEEAAMVYRSVVASLGSLSRQAPLMVFDLGGGSTEIACGAGKEVGRFVSLPMGAVSLTERFIRSDPPAGEELLAMDAAIGEVIMHNCAHFPKAPAILAGVGGTMTLLASMNLGMRTYDPSRINGAVIPHDVVRSVVSDVARMTRGERIALPVMGEGRADIIVAGLRVVLGLARYFQPELVVASSQGLRYGLVREAAVRARAAGRGSTASPAPGAGGR